MKSAKLKIVGCGDAFGTGGLHATCFYLETEYAKCLIDIGAGSLPNLKAMGINPHEIDLIVLSHFHGDHFGGLPNFLLDATFTQGRKKELIIAGPGGLEKRIWELQEAMYGGTSTIEFGFPIYFKEYVLGQALYLFHGLRVEAIPVVHIEPSNPHAIKMAFDDKFIVYTGDTEWTDELMALTKGCEILIAECFGWKEPMKYHLSYQEIIANIEELDAKRVFLTHLGPEAYSKRSDMKLKVLKPRMEIVI